MANSKLIFTRLIDESITVNCPYDGDGFEIVNDIYDLRTFISDHGIDMIFPGNDVVMYNMAVEALKNGASEIHFACHVNDAGS